jgi:hypothetical protein
MSISPKCGRIGERTRFNHRNGDPFLSVFRFCNQAVCHTVNLLAPRELHQRGGRRRRRGNVRFWDGLIPKLKLAGACACFAYQPVFVGTALMVNTHPPACHIALKRCVLYL